MRTSEAPPCPYPRAVRARSLRTKIMIMICSPLSAGGSLRHRRSRGLARPPLVTVCHHPPRGDRMSLPRGDRWAYCMWA